MPGNMLWLDRDALDSSSFVDERAHVDGTVKIGKGVKVWQFATVIRNTVLHDGVTVSPTAVLDGPEIGENTIISPGVFMGPGFLVGDDVFVGPNVILCNDAWPRTHKAGFDYAVLRSGLTVIVGDGASLGANAVVLPGVVIGQDAMVASGAVVHRDVPDFCLFTRNGEIRQIEGEERALNRRMRMLDASRDALVGRKPAQSAFLQMLRRKLGRKTLSWLQAKHGA